MLPRFWVAPPLTPGLVELSEMEANHLAQVLRMGVGETVEVFDGAGTCGRATVTLARKRMVQVEVAGIELSSPETPRVILATASPKGERVDWLVEKLTELGVDTWIPLLTERTTVEPRDSKLERLRQHVIAACKQSGRNWVMTIAPPQRWGAFLSSRPQGERLLIACPGSPPLRSAFVDPLVAQRDYCIAIGPEGGWTPAELDAASTGVQVGLGPHILRIETAAIAAAASVRALSANSSLM